jgi:hypothetical protein
VKRGELQFCSECRRRWPKGAEFDLRGFGWLSDLPRHITPSNIDCVFHDGGQGRNRFLVIETKGPSEWPDKGQERLLRSLSAQPRTFVVMLRGVLETLDFHRITVDRIELQGRPTTPEAVSRAVSHFLDGALWRDCEAGMVLPRLARPVAEHLHAWAKDDAGFICAVCQRRWGSEGVAS